MWLAVMTRILPDGAEFEYQYQKETAREIYKLARHLCSTEEKAIVGIYSDPEFVCFFAGLHDDKRQWKTDHVESRARIQWCMRTERR